MGGVMAKPSNFCADELNANIKGIIIVNRKDLMVLSFLSSMKVAHTSKSTITRYRLWCVLTAAN
jgi:hypothetical protein